MTRLPNPVLLTLIMCFAQVATLVDAFVFATLIKTFEVEWLLSKVQQGWIAGIYSVSYLVAVPFLMTITDSMDARRIYMVGCLMIAASAVGSALLAEGFWSALVFRALSGLGFAATYMPGLRVLVDRYVGKRESRAIAFYTSSWSLGTAISYLLAGIMAETLGWQWAFGVGAIGAILAFLAVALCLGPLTPTRVTEPTRLLDFRPVLKNRAVVGYVIGYAAHTWELLAFRTWLVAFLVFCLSQQNEPMVGWFAEPARVATMTGIAAMFSSVLGNELASRFNRARVITIIQITTACLACTIGFLGDAHYGLVAGLVVLYALMVQADSASLTAGVVVAAEEGRRGATLAVYNVVGWTGGFLGPVLVGTTLGWFGMESVTGWGFGFIAMGGITFFGALAVTTLVGRQAR